MPKKKKSQKTNPEAAASAESADTRQNKLQTSREARIAEIEAKYAKRSAVLENNNKALTQEIEK
ncbi:MAG: hypothetical protein GWN55_13095, partial [Phycisphaerae bacterium]|nr:hypothetical protein [Phycisphaerae bacterium]NIU28055.1 hypothetical protein [candidate division KSB1 bacterium]NIP51038.1 hypothetical protein [Phycisphaerae bacterium]NIS50258.1 hypothetical protein [Phycisphaerae bacterium]NIV02233.1 hypothetical protein [Phycisphaerae bacterium]